MTIEAPDAAGVVQVKPLVAGDVDLFSDEFFHDPYPLYARLRVEQPVAYLGALNAWFLTRHEDVKQAFNDERLKIDFERLQVNRMGPTVVAERFYAFGREFMAFADPPYHTKIKRLFMQGFTRGRADQHLPVMKRIVDEVIDGFIDRHEVDISRQFAHEVPLRIIGGLLGIPRSDQKLLEGWIQDYNPVIGFPPMSVDQTRNANSATEGFDAYFRDLVAHRVRHPGDDLLTEMLARNQAEEFRVDEFQVVANLILLYFAGQDTQKGHLGNILVALHENPVQLDWLREDSRRVWEVANELMRYDSVSQITGRVASEELDIGGTRIGEGQTILLGVGAANRDPARFADPDRLYLKREEARFNLSFGGGRHACLGSGIARLSIPLMLERLLRRIPNLRVDLDRLQRNRTLSKRGYGSIPASWS